MAIKGSLKEASLADVCQLLALGQKTGCLSITDRSRFGQIFFERGRITYSRIINRRDRLGDVLVHAGALTQEQLDQALEVQAHEPDRKLGEVLVESGLITQDDLKRYIRFQIEEAIYHLFTWSRGSFFFEADQRPEHADILVSINPDSLLLEAARRVDEWSLIEKKIPSLDLIFQVDQERAKESFSDLTPEQQRILTLLDGAHSIAEIADETSISEFEVGKALYGLIQAGFASRIGNREEEVPRGKDAEVSERRNLGVAFYRTAMLDEARREFERLLELNPGDVQARFHLALIELREHKYREALRQLKALLNDTGPRYSAFVNMAFALRALGRPQDALLVLTEAEQIRPGRSGVALARAVAFIEAGQTDEAGTALQQYIQRLSGNDRPVQQYYYYAALLAALGKRLNEAEALTIEGLQEHTESAPLLLLAGLIAERKGEYQTAEKWFRLALEEDPSLVVGYKNLGDVFYRRGALDESLQQYNRALELHPDLGDDTFAKLGNIFYRRGERAEAMRFWNRALDLNPGNQVVRNNLEIAQDV